MKEIFSRIINAIFLTILSAISLCPIFISIIFDLPSLLFILFITLPLGVVTTIIIIDEIVIRATINELTKGAGNE